MVSIEQALRYLVEQEGSDLHIKAGSFPRCFLSQVKQVFRTMASSQARP